MVTDPSAGSKRRRLLALGVAGTVALLLALLDPLEGFPLVLTGGALVLATARAAASRWLGLAAWGLGLAAAGCAAMLALTARGGVGGARGAAMPWILLVAPYPVGGILLLAGGLLVIRELRRLRQSNDGPPDTRD